MNENTTCTECGNPLPPNAIICIDCGFDLTTGKFLKLEDGTSSPFADSENPYESPTAAGSVPEVCNERLIFAVNFAKHIAFSFSATVAVLWLRYLFTGNEFGSIQFYTFFAVELFVPAFFLGVYFSRSAYPFRGFIGVLLGFFVYLLLSRNQVHSVEFLDYGIMFELAVIGKLVASAIVSIVPALSEISGIVVGRWIQKNLA